ncbi:hypothetical protein R1flu_016061 [Riccia fluitans]|uniref:Uncharacterized protein n=1 Tax=Riccia fluitans TaxID=41844 RepID=A0ABD1YLJ2_9MARC
MVMGAIDGWQRVDGGGRDFGDLSPWSFISRKSEGRRQWGGELTGETAGPIPAAPEKEVGEADAGSRGCGPHAGVSAEAEAFLLKLPLRWVNFKILVFRWVAICPSADAVETAGGLLQPQKEKAATQEEGQSNVSQSSPPETNRGQELDSAVEASPASSREVTGISAHAKYGLLISSTLENSPSHKIVNKYLARNTSAFASSIPAIERDYRGGMHIKIRTVFEANKTVLGNWLAKIVEEASARQIPSPGVVTSQPHDHFTICKLPVDLEASVSDSRYTELRDFIKDAIS